MKKPVMLLIIFAICALLCTLSACTTNNYSASLSGASDYSTVAVKDFVSLGIITVQSAEIHHSSAFGIAKRVEGSKITFVDLMQEAAKLEADDIINVRIDMNTNYVKRCTDWITGWTRTYTYTGTALAIKYTGKVDAAESQLNGLPKIPENTGAVKTDRDGRVRLR